MGGLSIWHWLIVLAVVLILFGSGRVGNLMGELGKGMKSFKNNLADDQPKDASMLEQHVPPPPVQATTTDRTKV
ncbi:MULTISPECIES: twin-arginine translocase TatA/TatE family subunit [Acidiphilium]|jgi:sec-independent protein translocase protein TatA|uniref:Sec-independent protein translocase protein TatA n=1 Tax=Acidiphilium rubrum TaxID=526 RepID=A0A8G2CJ10_ACIRU|nr:MULTISPECIES: twin-arginine translocase TatA/TatE family subunit [Acidiphilium]MBW4033875.1 twin-arginine translocase TatA/TatE family subunit [Pseudomonadota bacterium]OYW00908.1 MAG: twin-arginine translocase TatA/TatE family subunit [Acidiphilium sp. 37-64-53]OZB27311.1 MAG: twin-arginine translocase TatA/TatE family subunit [Acidiphilium sp. 34-64-41]SIQ39932.1 sec-independent protein translocase protein TatA [Acidiphilium rubrum]HQT86218.1 twin-arginine translocase TatA/TatE family sub